MHHLITLLIEITKSEIRVHVSQSFACTYQYIHNSVQRDRRNNDGPDQDSNPGLDHYYFYHPITHVYVNTCMSLVNMVKDTSP